jgi:formate dehydrogenase accessory protein FdhE
MRDPWDVAIARAEQLAAADEAARELLSFTAALLRAQRDVYAALHWARAARAGATAANVISSGPLTGQFEADLPRMRPLLLPLCQVIAAHGPDALARGAADLQAAHPAALDDMLIEYWETPTDDQFFAKAFLQPYARALADAKIAPGDRAQIQPDNRCPFCGGTPQLVVLRGSDVQVDGGRRHLLCSTCLTVWPFRRILCPQCGEEDERKLGYFHAAGSAYAHVRVEACASCQHYLKAVDLSKAGLAVPIVDEIAASALDVWATDQGLTKIERNLVGL